MRRQARWKAWRRTCIGRLVIKTQPLAKPAEEELHQAMLNGIREKGLNVLNWTPEAEQLRLRLHCAAQWLPEEAWPAVDEASLLASLEQWLLPQMAGVHSLRALEGAGRASGAAKLAAVAAASEAGQRAAHALYGADR